MGIVHHPNYVIWFENGRIDLLHKCGISYSQMEKRNEYFPLVSVACKYYTPAKFDDELVAKTIIVKANESRVCFGAWIYHAEDIESGKNPLAKLFSEHAYTEEDFTARPVPESILTVMKANVYKGNFFSKRKRPPGI
jgi:acyl-CoA thioester hydrolase